MVLSGFGVACWCGVSYVTVRDYREHSSFQRCMALLRCLTCCPAKTFLSNSDEITLGRFVCCRKLRLFFFMPEWWRNPNGTRGGPRTQFQQTKEANNPGFQAQQTTSPLTYLALMHQSTPFLLGCGDYCLYQGRASRWRCGVSLWREFGGGVK